MLDGYHLITLTHRETALENIGRAMAPNGTEADVLARLKAEMGWSELLYLATCNRVAYLFYHAGPLPADCCSGLLRCVRPEHSEAAVADIAPQMQLLHGAEAIHHWLAVAASMDSLVVGEREIIRQIREAYDQSRHWGLTGDHLRLLMRFTIETAKEIYSQTGIGEKALSVVALAFNALQRALPDPNSRILLVGAGQTNALFVKFLLKSGYQRLSIFNRSLERAQALAALSPQGRAFPLDALAQYGEGFDALVVCTGATQPIVQEACYRQLLQGDSTPKPVVDLSVPNNVDKGILGKFDIQFIDIEGLKAQADENLQHRRRECARAEAIIAERLHAFRERWHKRQVERSLAHVPDAVRAVKDKAVQEVFAKSFQQQDAATQALILDMLDYMEKKCVAIPMKAVKAIALQKPGKPRIAVSD